MITLGTILLLGFIWVLFDIKDKSGSWKEFNPLEHGMWRWVLFVVGLAEVVVLILYLGFKYLP